MSVVSVDVRSKCRWARRVRRVRRAQENRFRRWGSEQASKQNQARRIVKREQIVASDRDNWNFGVAWRKPLGRGPHFDKVVTRCFPHGSKLMATGDGTGTNTHTSGGTLRQLLFMCRLLAWGRHASKNVNTIALGMKHQRNRKLYRGLKRGVQAGLECCKRHAREPIRRRARTRRQQP